MLPIIPPQFFLNPATYAAALRTFGGAGASTILAYVLAQHLWRHTPEWIREDESWQALFAKRSQRQQQTTNAINTGKRLQGNHYHDVANVDVNTASTSIAEATEEFVDEMASLTAVVQKLEALVITGYEKLGSRRGGLRRRRRVVRRAVMLASSSRQELLNDTVIANDENAATNDESCCNCNPSGQGQQQPIIAQSSLGEDHNNDEEHETSPLEWHAALLAYWQLSNQLRKRHPSWRDEVYDAQYNYHPPQVGQSQQSCQKGDAKQQTNCSSSNNDNNHESNDGNNSDSNITCSQIKELQTMLQFAIWAYESNEDLLRSFLESSMIDYDACDDDDQEENNRNATSNNGLKLIVHRTTSYMEPASGETTTAEAATSNTTTTTPDIPSSSKKKRKPPGRVGYYVAISHTQRTLLIGMKGTSTIEELLTDCCGRAVRVDLENDPHGYCPPLVAVNDTGDSETDYVIDDDANDNTDPYFQPQGSMEEAILDEKNATSSTPHGMAYNFECEECGGVDEELVHVSPCTGDIGAGRRWQEAESIEVELLHHSCRNYHRHVAVSTDRSLDDATTSGKHRQVKLQLDSSTKPNTLARDVPSVDNVLLFSSAPTLLPSSSPTRNINIPNLTSLSSTQVAPTSEFARSSTNEYVESNGVEMEENRSHKLRGVHEGILHCAQQLLFEISPLIEEYGLLNGYDVVCTGHSLGAGTAVVLAVLIRGRYPELRGLSLSLASKRGGAYHDDHTRCNETNIVRRERVRAYAFATPPVLDRESSMACRHYVISVINGSDIIPRSSLTNLDVFLTVLEAVRSRLVEAGMNPGRSKSACHHQSAKKTNVIASTIALFSKLCEGTEGELLLNPSELRIILKEAIAEAFLGDGEDDKLYWNEEFGHHLFVPGKLLLMYEAWSSTLLTEVANEEAPSIEAAQASTKGTKDRSEHERQSKGGKFHAIWTDGTNSVLKIFEIGGGSRMVTDHLTTSYQRSLERCQTQLL